MPTPAENERIAEALLGALMGLARHNNEEGASQETYYGAGFNTALLLVKDDPDLLDPLLAACDRWVERTAVDKAYNVAALRNALAEVRSVILKEPVQ